MEQNLKAMLNIGGGKGRGEAGVKLAAEGLQPGQLVSSSGQQQQGTSSQDNPLLALLTSQSFCSDLLDLLNSLGRSPPRYDHIRDPVSGGINAQVTLDDSSIFHSPLPMPDQDAACELAAKLALESVRKEVESSRNGRDAQGVHVPGQQQVSRGKGRGRMKAEQDQEQQGIGPSFQPFQPWAQPADESEMEVRQEQRKPNIRKQEKGMAGTAQMDIMFRETADQQQPAGGEQPPTKPQIFGVPLQVVKKSVKPTVKQITSAEPEKEAVEEIPSKVLGDLDKVTRSNSSSSMGSRGRGSLSKESTPARGGAAARKPRKPRLAANFGGVPPPQ